PGPAGTSAINGKVTGQDFIAGENEVQQIIFTSGAQIEHGDYFLLNEVKDGNNYYIYFKNPTWVSSANPNIQGRIGLEVVFNYSDANTTIAQAVKNKIAGLGILNFNMALDQDILTLAYKSHQAIPDPDNGTTNFALDVANQGSADYISPMVQNMAEKNVYICYGENTFASDNVKTNAYGDFQFTNLQVGTYKVYVVSENPPIDGQHIEIEQTIEITAKGSISDLGTLHIFH
ncbi:MAG: hypothetical protein K9J18_09895, partial [Crocinitomicaceae bacterium]|nr:hypothetical protein [Crocinitomicaceae bacterium]